MNINRVRAPAQKATFLISPIKKLLMEEMDNGIWADPFCGENSPASTRNDLNPNIAQANYHLDAKRFLETLKSDSVDGVLLDPPYSPRQVSDCYKGFGKEVTSIDTQGRPLALVRKEVARVLKPGGKAICFGWNSCGIGKSFGFEMLRILLVCHTAITNDTIVTVERKIQAGF